MFILQNPKQLPNPNCSPKLPRPAHSRALFHPGIPSLPSAHRMIQSCQLRFASLLLLSLRRAGKAPKLFTTDAGWRGRPRGSTQEIKKDRSKSSFHHHPRFFFYFNKNSTKTAPQLVGCGVSWWDFCHLGEPAWRLERAHWSFALALVYVWRCEPLWNVYHYFFQERCRVWNSNQETFYFRKKKNRSLSFRLIAIETKQAWAVIKLMNNKFMERKNIALNERQLAAVAEVEHSCLHSLTI